MYPAAAHSRLRRDPGRPDGSCAIVQAMEAAVCRVLGSLESLSVEEVDPPRADRGQVVVEVEAAGLSYMDVLLAQGRYQVPVRPPYIPGSEFAGRIVEIGSGVSRFQVGQRVVGQCGEGAFAERVAVDVGNFDALPDGIDVAVAATMLQSYSTALYALERRSPLQAGESLLVLGAGGGVGLAAIDVATGIGATVIGAASTDGKRAAAIAQGATAVVDSVHEDVKTRVRELTNDTLSMVFDPVGGDLAESALRALGFGGRYLVVGFAGSIPVIPLNLVLLNSRTVIGVEFGAAIARRPSLAWEINREVITGVAGGRFRPVRPEVVPLARVPEAFAALAGRTVTGKLALAIGRSSPAP